MSTNFQNIVLIGGNGSIGKILLRALISDDTFKVTIVSRSNTKPEVSSPTLTVIQSDFTHGSLVKAFQGADAVISAVGATGFADQKTAIDAAIEAGVKRFFPSEWSTNTRSDAVRELLPLFNVKKGILDYLAQKGNEDAISWTAVGPGLLFDWGLSNGFLGFDIAAHTATIWDNGSTVFSVTNEATLGAALLAVLKQAPDVTKNRHVYIQSFATTQNEILAAFEKHTGRSFTITKVTTEDQVGLGRQLLGKEDMNGVYLLVRASAFGAGYDIKGNYAKDEKDGFINDILDLGEESVDETVARVVKPSM